MQRIRLINWKIEEIEDEIINLKKAGYNIITKNFTGPDDLKELRSNPPSAVIIDLTRLPSHGRDIALTIRQYKSTRHVPIVFIEGDPEKTNKIKSLLPDAVFSNWGNILPDLKNAIENPPLNPVKIKSAMDGYSGTPLNKKLGIKPGITVTLINSPDGFQAKFNDIPDVKFITRYNSNSDLIIWFVLSLNELESKIKKILPYINDGGIWFSWKKKSSGLVSDLSENIVRQTGLASGLVDYKICSIDETWSALKFRVRKPKN